MIEEVLTIGGAGHETTANTLSWAMLLLAENPEKQETFWKEIAAKVVGEVPTFEEAKRLDYARAILYETLRLYPTVAMFPRMSAQDCKMHGYDIPKGSMVVVSQEVLNRNPAWFPEPDAFKPERFEQHSGGPVTTLPRCFAASLLSCLSVSLSLSLSLCVFSRCVSLSVCENAPVHPV